MKANPGGQLAPSEVIGRDELILRLWRILERQSLVLTAERRIGKTSVIKKMKAEAPDTVLPIYHDLEGTRTPLEFAELVLHDVEAYLSGKGRFANRARKLLAELTSTEIGGVIKLPEHVAPHWKTLLKTVVEDLAEYQDRTLLFFWDEVPIMLHNVKKREGEEVAMEMLDVLREIRQMHGDVRMVFTGSIGLHNVITALKEAGYANAPLNDMRTINVEPLTLEHAQHLASRLLEGEGIDVGDTEQTAQAIAEAVDRVPYYIHYVVDALTFLDQPVDVARVERVVTDCLTDPQDGWHMAHYRERIDTYYTRPAQRALVLAVLDALAAEEPLPFEALFNRIKLHTQLADEEAERVRDTLTLLQRDHYLVLDADSAYRFRFPLVRRWWNLHRG